MLKITLGLNAAFSTINGLVVLTMSMQMADFLFVPDFILFGMSPVTILQVLGIGLLLFAAYVGFVAWSLPKQIEQVKFVIMADWLWVVSTIILFAFAAHIFTYAGLWFFVITALIVAGFAIKQTKFLKMET